MQSKSLPQTFPTRHLSQSNKVHSNSYHPLLINLCNNAIKFTKEAYVLVNVSSHIENGTLLFEVSDTDIGIQVTHSQG